MAAGGIRASQYLLLITALVVGLVADAQAGFALQAAIGLGFWAMLSWVLGHVSAEERRALMACVVIATAGEMFLSLAWGLYSYRLDNIPLYVPPGHALLLMLGFALARKMPEWVALAILGGAAIYTLAAAAAGLDTFGLVLCLVLGGAALAMPAHRRLYASTVVLSLVLELSGTALGNWRWVGDVPVLGLVTTNPPGVSAAFYCVLDALVAGASLLIARRFGSPEATGGRLENVRATPACVVPLGALRDE